MTRTSAVGNSSRGTEGFTFLELIAVLFVVSLFFALAMPRFSLRDGTSHEALKTASVLRELNDGAIARKARYSLLFDFGGRALEWEGPEGKKQMALESLHSVTIPSRGEVRDGTLTLFFGPSGAPEDITVRLAGDGKEAGFRVVLQEMNGKVRVIEETEG